MKKKHNRIWIFIGLKLAETLGLAIVGSILFTIVYFVENYLLGKYIVGAIHFITIVILIYFAIRVSWGWAGEIVKKKKK